MAEKKAAAGVRVKPRLIDIGDGRGDVAAQVRNPFRGFAPVPADGDTLPMNAWLLRRIREGDLIAINAAGDAIEVDDFGNEVPKSPAPVAPAAE